MGSTQLVETGIQKGGGAPQMVRRTRGARPVGVAIITTSAAIADGPSPIARGPSGSVPPRIHGVVNRE